MKPRPSAFHLAKLCPRSAQLGAMYPESMAHTAVGKSVDAEISAAIDNLSVAPGHRKPVPDMLRGMSKSAQHCFEWFRAAFPWVEDTDDCCWIQKHLILASSDTCEVIEEGTPDLIVRDRADPDRLTIVDWKKREQVLAGLLPDIEDNDQLRIYWAMAISCLGGKLGRYVVAAWDEDGVYPEWSRELTLDDYYQIVAEVDAAPDVPQSTLLFPDGAVAYPKPGEVIKCKVEDIEGCIMVPPAKADAHKGDHCRQCYNRHHCDAYLLPEGGNMPAALVPLSVPGPLDRATATEAARWLKNAQAALKAGKELTEVVDGALEHYCRTTGETIDVDGKKYGAIMDNGKRSGPKIEELEAMGMVNLIKPAKPSLRYGWKRGK